MQCPKCKSHSGDNWNQCNGDCPMPGSPHYNKQSDFLADSTIESLIGTGAILEIDTHVDDAKFLASLAKARGIHLAARINPQLTLAYLAQDLGEFMAKEAIRGVPAEILQEIIARNIDLAWSRTIEEYKAKMAILETADESNPQ